MGSGERKDIWSRVATALVAMLCVAALCAGVSSPQRALAAASGSGTGAPDSFLTVNDKERPFKGNTLETSDAGNFAIELGATPEAIARAAATVLTKVPKGAKVAKEDPIPNGTAEEAREYTAPTVPTVPATYTPNPTTEEFIAAIGEQARDIGQKNGLYASVMIAQAILESGSGGSGLSKPPYNNLFGIKGAYKGSSVYMYTQEDDGSGNYYDIVSAFRSYPSTRESLQDYADLLTKQMASFYAPAWKANAATYADACDYLQGHYATSTSYSSSLQGLIIAYDLVQFDNPAPSEAKKDKVVYAAVTQRGGASADSGKAAQSAEATAGGENGPDSFQAHDRSQAQESAAGREAAASVAEAARGPAAQTATFAISPTVVLLVLLAKSGTSPIVFIGSIIGRLRP